jgi:hypothetical protein
VRSERHRESVFRGWDLQSDGFALTGLPTTGY